MTTWILAVLVLYFCQIYLTALMYLPTAGFVRLAGGRDALPDKGKFAGRADKALVNMKENLPFFLVPALLIYVVPNANLGLAVLGAQMFFFGRLIYIPLYLSGIPGPRSIGYGIALIGNILIALSLLGG